MTMTNSISGRLSKMAVYPDQQNTAQYSLVLDDQLYPINQHLGKEITIKSLAKITCIYCQAPTKQSYQQGYCYRCFLKLARCDYCVLQPVKCHYHQGTCREPSWGKQNCFQTHIVYLANTSTVKIGITRENQIPTRWLDQGASYALPIIKTSDRHTSGIIEHAAKQFVSDRTNWRKMLQNKLESIDLLDFWQQLHSDLAEQINQLNNLTIITQPSVSQFNYPALEYPEKITSLNLDKTPQINGLLLGIKGQYLILTTGVINLRKFTGYHVELNVHT